MPPFIVLLGQPWACLWLQVNRQLRQQARRSQEGIYTPTKALEVDDCEEECDIERASVLETLRFGRNKLREGQAQAALLQFEKALEILRSSKNFERPLEAERKAYRGIGSAQVWHAQAVRLGEVWRVSPVWNLEGFSPTAT